MEHLFIVLAMVTCISCDIYMHSPRGSNNRLREQSANRNNANRVFDSQNNNRGGYNVGDRDNNPSQNNETKQFQMTHFMSSKRVMRNPKSPEGQSILSIEWTNQHGAGGNEDEGPNKMNSNFVIQFLAQPVTGNFAPRDKKATIRDGTSQSTNNHQAPRPNEKQKDYLNRRNGNVKDDRVVQEQIEWYDKCITRKRNGGLFTADQKVKPQAIHTRQNPNGNRRGYECPEERDYYPYWHPTEWKDIAIIAHNSSMCKFYQKESFNVKEKYECVESWPDNASKYRHFTQHNNEAACKTAGGKWLPFVNYLERTNYNENQCNSLNKNGDNRANRVRYVWGIPMRLGTTLKDAPGSPVTPECLVALNAPDCLESPFSRDNHLGNGEFLENLRYDWVLPFFPSGVKHRIVLRIRYNISTDDYDGWNTNSSFNKNQREAIRSPVEQNPAVDIGALNIPMRLAINTAQYGRTFQDRSHMFYLEKRPTTVRDERLFNVQVRGKRGNIVQTYPAVEYDFFPTNLKMKTSDLVHFQWTGSNTHNNGNPAGDGQAGNDGQGKAGTDRNNILGLADRLDNFPLPMEDKRNFVKNSALKWAANVNVKDLSKYDTTDVAVMLSSSGYFQCVQKSKCGAQSVEQKAPINALLDNAPASFGGVVLQVRKRGTFHYTCTRNNNFSNRSQKASLIVE